MKKRIIAFMLAALMLFAVTGCGESDSETSSGSQGGDGASSEAGISIDKNEYINEDGTITVPDLKNMPLEQARALLKELGLKSKFSEEYDSTGNFEVGCVMKTDYEPGEKVKKGTQIFLTVRKEGTFLDPNVPYVDPLVEARGDLKQGANSDYKPLNYETMKAVWISQFDLDVVLRDITLRSEESLKALFGKPLTHAEELLSQIKDKLYLISKKQKVDYKALLSEVARRLKEIKDPFLTSAKEAALTESGAEVEKASFPVACADHDARIAVLVAELVALRDALRGEEGDAEQVTTLLTTVQSFLEVVISGTRPNFFRIGYYKLKNPEQTLDGSNIEALNEMALSFLMDDFMSRFLELETAGVKNSYEKSLEAKKELLVLLDEAKAFFLADHGEGGFTKKEAKQMVAKLSVVLEKSIDKLQFNKDSVAYTFVSSLTAAINKYFLSLRTNAMEEKRFATQTAKRDRLIARGKKVDWKVVPKVVYDVDELKGNITLVIDRLKEKYEADVAAAASVDFDAMAVALIDFFKEKASQVVYRVTKKIAKEKAIKLMEEVGIPEPRTRFNQYPFEFSGGMRQRIVIAIALAANPEVLICDEPTTALDVTIQAQILELINDLKRKRNLSVIFITHDLGVVANMADRIAVMYAGKIVEQGTAEDVFYDPRHPYTWALLSSMPDLDTNEKLEAIPGTPPHMIYPPVGDAFAERNKYALKIDFEMEPPMFRVSDTHYAATWLLHPDAPKVELPKIIRDRIARLNSEGGEADV